MRQLIITIIILIKRTCAVCTLDTRSDQYTHLHNYLLDTLSLAQHECIYRINATTYYYYYYPY